MTVLKFRLRTLMGVVALVALGFGLLEFGQVSLGIGSTSLRITLVVEDAGTLRPIERATIEIQEEDFPATPVVVTTTDLAGKFIREGITKMTSRRTAWRSTCHAYLPDLAFRIFAPGYESSPWMRLASPEHRQALKSGHPLSTLDMKIRLSKSPSFNSVSTKSAERAHR